MVKENNLKPVVPWVGGKRQLIPKLMEYKPETFNKYYEPFIGGGAFLFALQPDNFVINDYNEELINMYKVIKTSTNELLEVLKKPQSNNTKEYYLEIRALDRDFEKFSKMSNIERAARLIYMLKVDFNGLYRVNKKGQFNVPYGRYKNPKIADKNTLFAAKEFFNNTKNEIISGDFEKAVKTAKKSDFVYFDPPYIPLTETADFTSYTSKGFSMGDQVRLKEVFFELANKGVNVMLSNSDTPITRELYKDVNIHEVQATRAINSVANKRGKIDELIITSY